MMETDNIGIYVHIPFCVRKCNYCDFCSHAGNEAEFSDYTEALCKEISAYSDLGLTADTVFFGGGTPSVLPLDLFEKIMLEIRRCFRISDEAEITLELNPGTVSVDSLRFYKRLGINRLSFGLQSIHENEMKILGRIHTYGEFTEAYSAARALGFGNISVDLMYGIPEQTEESFKRTLESVIALSPNHVSCYGLIIEEGTPFFKNKGELCLPDEDSEVRMYKLAADTLFAAGYRHYEISNYAKPGFESRHNLKYWKSREYVGLGVAAHSCFGRMRFQNTSDFDEYLEKGSSARKYDETSLPDPFEYAMLALRLSDGIAFSEYERLFGKSFIDGRESEIDRFAKSGHIVLESDSLHLSEDGFYVSNYIMSSLL